MEELIPITDRNGQRAVNARDLHVFLESKQDFSTWIKNRIDKYDLAENVDYVVFHKYMENPNGGRPQIEYALTIDAAKELSMVEGNEKGKQARRYFIECEKQLRLTPVQASVQDKIYAANWLASFLNLNDVSRLELAAAVVFPLGLPTPAYVPAKDTIHSATDRLRQRGIKLSAVKFNQKMVDAGMMKRESRYSRSKGETVTWPVLIGDGLIYGNNQISPKNPRETQPNYYDGKFDELLTRLNIQL